MNSQTNLLVDRMLTVLREDVLPLTQEGVREGNKVFGAAVLRKASLELVIAGTNEEAQNPLLHGEISCLNRYWSLPGESRPPPAECLFLSTHEPCPMCLSAIAWSGFDNFYYLFSYEDSRDEFKIPHDLAILIVGDHVPTAGPPRSHLQGRRLGQCASERSPPHLKAFHILSLCAHDPR